MQHETQHIQLRLIPHLLAPDALVQVRVRGRKGHGQHAHKHVANDRDLVHLAAPNLSPLIRKQ